MATFEVFRTARTAKQCENYPRCERGIQPGERYLRASATPHDSEVNQGDHWWTINICCEHMRPERLGPECMSCHDGRGLPPDWECSGCGRVGSAVRNA